VTGTVDLSLADGKLVGERGFWTGEFVSGAGDVDGDGHDDFLVGSRYDTEGGAAHLILGPVAGTFEVSLADARFVGEEEEDYACAVSGAGDVDADGRADILVGAFGSDPGGAVYLVYGGGL
jgi:hypothetical protein